jgi:hypothetical protein
MHFSSLPGSLGVAREDCPVAASATLQTPPEIALLPPPPPRLLDQLQVAARRHGHDESTVAAFVDWSRRFILFHNKRHPRDLGLPEVTQFLQPAVRALYFAEGQWRVCWSRWLDPFPPLLPITNP